MIMQDKQADSRRRGRSSQAFAAMDAALDRRVTAMAARGHGKKNARPRLQPWAGHVVRKTCNTSIVLEEFREVNVSHPGKFLQWQRYWLMTRPF
jgi:hypothetical protein